MGRILRGSEEKNEEILKMWVDSGVVQAVVDLLEAVVCGVQAV